MKGDVIRTLAVLLTVHNRREQTIACLNNLYGQQLSVHLAIDVYMVDDGCTDGTADIVHKQFPNVYIIRADGSLYWNRGMWTAWDVASKTKNYDFFLWLNDDTFLFNNAVAQMLALSKEYSDEIIVAGTVKASMGDKLTYGGSTKTNIARCEGVPTEIYGFNGNIVLVPQAVYAILGNLDYYYRHSKGDFDYALRARKAGIKMYQCGNVLGICDGHDHIATWCNPQVTFCQRWKAMHQPTGMPPNEVFHYERKINVIMAIFHVISNYFRCAFPQLWIKRSSKQIN